jgi:hypothetical protein
MTDLPFTDLAAAVDQAIERHGGTQRCQVYVKFTCASCGARQTFDVPNTLYTSGRCEECGSVTSLEERGGGFLLVLLPPKPG